jgi:hypothetical protein
MLLASFQTDFPHFFSTQALVLCHIESTKAGTLIGKEGANIKKIAQECGMHNISVLSTEVTDGKCAVVAETYSTDERVARTANRFIESILIANGNITAIPFHVNEMDMFKMGSIRKMMLLTRQLHILGYPVYMISHIHAIGSFRFAVRYVDEPDIDMFRSPYEEPCIIRYSGPGHYDILKGVEAVEECIVSSPRKLASKLAVLKGLVRKPFGSRMTSHARWFALICLSSVQFCDEGFSERFDTHRSKLAEENSELDFSNTLTSGSYAIRKPFILDECEGRVRHKLADAAKAGQWKTVMQILDIYVDNEKVQSP